MVGRPRGEVHHVETAVGTLLEDDQAQIELGPVAGVPVEPHAGAEANEGMPRQLREACAVRLKVMRRG